MQLTLRHEPTLSHEGFHAPASVSRSGSARFIDLHAVGFTACGDASGDANGFAGIQNDFNYTQFDFQPPWSICKASHNGIEFDKIAIGETSDKQEVPAGLDYVLMVAAWADPDCKPENCLPIATKNEEELVKGQTRTIAINLPSHQGPCPPEGTAPIPPNNTTAS